MALPNYSRLLFIGGTDTIANTPADVTELSSYLSTNGFTGVYLAQGSFDTNASNINSLITTLNVPLVGAVGGSSASADIVNTYNLTYHNANFFLMYDNFWYSGQRFAPTGWLDEYQGITNISRSFWTTNYQNTQSSDIRTSGYTEVDAAIEQIAATGYTTNVGVLLSTFEQGVPRYFSAANDKKSTNIFNKLDILAEAVRTMYAGGTLPGSVQLLLDTTFLDSTKWYGHVYNDIGNLWYPTATTQFGNGRLKITTTATHNIKVLVANNSASISYPSMAGPCWVKVKFTTGRWDNTNPNSYVYFNVDNGYQETIGYTDTTKSIGPVANIQPYSTYEMLRYIPAGATGGASIITANPNYTSGHTWAIHLFNSQAGEVNELQNLEMTAYPEKPPTKLPIHFYVHAGQIDFGSSEDFSGYSIQAASSFDNFEKKLVKNVVDRMTKFQKDHLIVKGFAYYKYPYAQAALNAPGNITGFSAVPSQNSAFLSWSPGTGGTPTSYSVYVSSTTPVPTGSMTPTVVTSPSITVTGLSSSTPYYVVIVANNGVGSSSGPATNTFTTTSVPVAPALGEYRILLIEEGVIGDTAKENERLSYANTIGANFIQMYGGYGLSATDTANFIKKARTTYGIQKVGVIVNGKHNASQSIAYNDSRIDPDEKWDDFNIESEFWASGGSKVSCRVYVSSAVNGSTYTIRINGVDHTITAASTNTTSVTTQLYNKLVADFGGTSFYNTMSFTQTGNYISIVGSSSVTYGPEPAPVTGPTNVFTSGTFTVSASTHNPDQLYCPVYVEAKYNGVLVSGDRSPNALGTDDPNYDQTKIGIMDRPTGMTTLTWMACAKYLMSASVARGNEWTVSAYVANYGSVGSTSNRWGLVEAKYMMENLDIYEATNYVSSISVPSNMKGQLYYMADATRLYGASRPFGAKASQSFVPLWSAECPPSSTNTFNGLYLKTYSASFYPNMSGGLDQAESDWSSSYISNTVLSSRSYLDYTGTAYFHYPHMKINYKYP